VTQDAFKKPGKSKMDRLRLLRLKPEDRVLTGHVALKCARFTWVTDPASAKDSAERWIVASCGQHTVLLNFRRCVPPSAVSNHCKSAAHAVCAPGCAVKG
jgi:hypothetical protein